MELKPQQENVIEENNDKTTYYYVDKNLKPIFRAKEIFKNESKIIIYPYWAIKNTDRINRPKIKVIEFRGWNSLEDLPKDFKKTYRDGNVYYGIKSRRLKQLFKIIYKKCPNVERLVVYRKNGKNRFYKKVVHFNWPDIEHILKQISRYTNYYFNDLRLYINNRLSEFSKKFPSIKRLPKRGEIKGFFEKFNSLDCISDADAITLIEAFRSLPNKNKILITENFIEINEEFNIAYLEKIIEHFKKLIKSTKDNEEDWQKFFEQNSWILSHLFPYQVFLYKEKAYVGGKTIENKDGKIVDFLLQNGFKDNYALLEIKTHKKKLLKTKPYRGEDVYPLSDELTGAVAQCLDQKDNFLKEWGRRIQPEPVAPRVVLVIGKRKDLTDKQVRSFELFRNNLKDIDVITFDELLGKIDGLYRVISKKKHFEGG